MKITMVKKIREDGAACRKCAEIEQRLQQNNLADKIDRVVIADERDPASEGMQLAARYNVDRAPFFIVEREGAEPVIYTVYFQFVKEVLSVSASEDEVIKDIIDQNPDLDYI